MQQTQQEPREDWSDEAWVDLWIQRQEARAPQRNRQFAMIRALVPAQPGDAFRYINVGAGPGALDELLLARFPNVRATLQDGSPLMLRRARERLERFGDRVEYVQADLATPAWREQIRGSFDLAVSSIAIHNLGDGRRIRALYAEIAEVLSPGGFFMNLDYVRPASLRFRALMDRATADPESGFMMGGGGGPATVEEQLIWLRDAGFAPVDCFWKEFRVALFGGFRANLPN